MEYIEDMVMSSTSGIVINKISDKGYNVYSQQNLCPTCYSTLTVFKSAWKYKEFVHTSGPLIGYKESCEVCQCPICSTYFTKNFKAISPTLEVLGII